VPRKGGAKACFRGLLRNVDATIDETIDQSSDDFRPVYPPSLFMPDLCLQPIQVQDLPLEQYD
jgi:hypothetical protein